MILACSQGRTRRHIAEIQNVQRISSTNKPRSKVVKIKMASKHKREREQNMNVDTFFKRQSTVERQSTSEIN